MYSQSNIYMYICICIFYIYTWNLRNCKYSILNKPTAHYFNMTPNQTFFFNNLILKILSRHRHPGQPPLLIVHGTADTVVPFREARAMRAQANATGLSSPLSILIILLSPLSILIVSVVNVGWWCCYSLV